MYGIGSRVTHHLKMCVHVRFVNTVPASLADVQVRRHEDTDAGMARTNMCMVLRTQLQEWQEQTCVWCSGHSCRNGKNEYVYGAQTFLKGNILLILGHTQWLSGYECMCACAIHT